MVSAAQVCRLHTPYAVDVVMQLGDSNTNPGNNLLSDLPTGYFTTDNNTYIWDAAGTGGDVRIRTLIPGGMERQPAGQVQVSVGSAGEFIKHYRTDNPAKPLYFFSHGIDNGRFSDAVSRSTNYNPAFNDGAYNSLRTQWNAFKAALHSLGMVPNIIGCRFSMGANCTLASAETTSFQSDMEGLIGAMISDGIVLSTTKLIFERIATIQTGLTTANIPAIRTATDSLANVDPAHREVMSADGYRPWSGDNVHWTAPSCVIMGEQFYYHCAGLWYPQKEQTYNSGNPVTHEYRPGDFRNTAGATAFTTTGGNLQTAWDCAGGGISPTQATDTKRPVISVSAVSGKEKAVTYSARYATADGVDDALTANSAFASSSSYGAFAAVAAPSGQTSGSARNLYGEGKSSTFQTLYQGMRGDSATGADLAHFSRDSSGGNLTNVTLVTGAWNNVMNFVGVTDTGTQITGYLNGTAGTPQSYTRGTLAADRFTLWGMAQTGSEGFWFNAKLGILWFTTAVPDATYRANAQTYCQRRWGTA